MKNNQNNTNTNTNTSTSTSSSSGSTSTSTSSGSTPSQQQIKQNLQKLGPAGSIILNLEKLKLQYNILMNQYTQAQNQYSQYLSQYPPGNYISNGTFSDPSITNDSYEYVTSTTLVPSWTFNNAILMNQSTDLGYPTPYPNGDQAVSLQQTASISQTINVNKGVYTLTFSACGRDCCDGSGVSNNIQVQLNGNTFYNVQPPVDVWTTYTTQFTIDINTDMSGNAAASADMSGNSFDASGNSMTVGNNTISFVGTWSTTDRSSAIQNIRIFNKKFSILKFSSFQGTNLSNSQVNNIGSCIASCATSSSCTGATYNNEQKLCSLKSGQGSVIPSSNSKNIAILPENLKYLMLIKNLNQQLISVNEQIAQNISQGGSIYNQGVQQLNSNSGNLNDRNESLQKERKQIERLIKEFEKLEADQTESSLYTSSYYAMFLFLLLISVIFIIILCIVTFTGSKPETSTTNSLNSISGFQKGGFFSNLFSS